MNKISVILKKEIAVPDTVKNVFLIILFSFLTFLGSLLRISLPFTPVPITLQTLAIFISIYYLDYKKAGISQLIYVLSGVLGLNVFAVGWSGAIILISPTAGYLIGFIISAVFMGYLKERLTFTYKNGIVIFITGTLIIYLLGIIHLMLFYHISLKKVMLIGVLPFIPGDILKILIASEFYKIYKRLR